MQRPKLGWQGITAVLLALQLYMWDYTQPRAVPVTAGSNGSSSAKQPHITLKTRRSLRAVHFHPHGRPLMLTAEVGPQPRLSLIVSQRLG